MLDNGSIWCGAAFLTTTPLGNASLTFFAAFSTRRLASAGIRSAEVSAVRRNAVSASLARFSSFERMASWTAAYFSRSSGISPKSGLCSVVRTEKTQNARSRALPFCSSLRSLLSTAWHRIHCRTFRRRWSCSGDSLSAVDSKNP
jgi:hypothetical protein